MEYLIIFILIIIVFFLGFKLYFVKRQMKNIAKQLHEVK